MFLLEGKGCWEKKKKKNQTWPRLFLLRQSATPLGESNTRFSMD